MLRRTDFCRLVRFPGRQSPVLLFLIVKGSSHIGSLGAIKRYTQLSSYPLHKTKYVHQLKVYQACNKYAYAWSLPGYLKNAKGRRTVVFNTIDFEGDHTFDLSGFAWNMVLQNELANEELEHFEYIAEEPDTQANKMTTYK
nr:CCAAT/enhancer-binding protein zeta [Tanacetum cinerariifolium]